MVNTFKVFISQVNQPTCNVEDFSEIWFVGLSVVDLDFGVLTLELFIKSSLLDQEAVDSNSLNLFGKGSNGLNFFFNLFLNSDLNHEICT